MKISSIHSKERVFNKQETVIKNGQFLIKGKAGWNKKKMEELHLRQEIVVHII